MMLSCTHVLTMFSPQVVPLLGRFSDIGLLLPNSDDKFDAVLFDVGMSSMQADNAHRGFSISRQGPLDMRLDGHRYLSAANHSTICAIISHNILCSIFV